MSLLTFQSPANVSCITYDGGKYRNGGFVNSLVNVFDHPRERASLGVNTIQIIQSRN